MANYSTPSSFLLKMAEHLTPEPTSPAQHSDDSKCIAAIVLPSGSGKSYFRAHYPGVEIKEADEICMPRATEALSEFRSYAKESGDWTLFDIEMAKILKSRLHDGDVIMVASVDLARAMDANILGVFALTPSRWRENILARRQDPLNYIEGYYDVYTHPSVVIFPGMGSLCDAISRNAETWTINYRRSQQ